MFSVCIPNAFLNMCSEPFVMTLNVRSARFVSTKVKLVECLIRRRIDRSIHGKLHFVLVIFVGNLSIAAIDSDLKLT